MLRWDSLHLITAQADPGRLGLAWRVKEIVEGYGCGTLVLTLRCISKVKKLREER